MMEKMSKSGGHQAGRGGCVPQTWPRWGVGGGSLLQSGAHGILELGSDTVKTRHLFWVTGSCGWKAMENERPGGRQLCLWGPALGTVWEGLRGGGPWDWGGGGARGRVFLRRARSPAGPGPPQPRSRRGESAHEGRRSRSRARRRPALASPGPGT